MYTVNASQLYDLHSLILVESFVELQMMIPPSQQLVLLCVQTELTQLLTQPRTACHLMMLTLDQLHLTYVWVSYLISCSSCITIFD